MSASRELRTGPIPLSRGSSLSAAIAKLADLLSGRGAAVTGAALVVAALPALAVFPPSARALVVDEWAYLKAVEHFARTGVFRPDPTAVSPDFIPIALSAGLGKLWGGELAWLRLVSVVSFILGGVILYRLATELGVRKRWATAAAMCAVANPIALPLAVTGMTDLAAAALFWGTCLAAIRYLKDPSRRLLIGFCVLSAAAASIRPIGAIPLAVFVVLAGIAPGMRRRCKEILLWGSFTLAVTLGGYTLFAQQSVSTVHYLEDALSASKWVWAKMLFLFPVHVFLYLCLVAIPVSVTLLASDARRRNMAAPVVAGAAAALLGASLTGPGLLRFPYMSWGSIFASNGIGGGDRPELPPALLIAISVAVGISSAVLVWTLLQSRDRFGEEKFSRGRFSFRETAAALEDPSAGLFIVAVVGLTLIATAAMGFAFDDIRTGYDRYQVPLLGLAMVWICGRISDRQVNLAAFGISLALVVVLVVVGIQDWRAHRNAAWSELEALSAGGVPPTKIDGGFEWSAYHQPLDYTPVFDTPEDAPWYVREFAPSLDREFVLSSSRLAGYEVIRTVRWKSWVRSGTLYLQRRTS